MLILETKLHHATKAELASQGGIAFAIWKDRGDQCETEDLELFGPNIIVCTMVSSGTRKWLIGMYLPPGKNYRRVLDDLVRAVMEEQDLVICLGNFNANLEESVAAQ